MPITDSAVGAKGDPVKRSWTSKDCLLYAVGVGAGTGELAFTTENSKGIDQRVLPTFAVIIGTGAAPIGKAGSFNPAMMVHGEQGIERSHPVGGLDLDGGRNRGPHEAQIVEGGSAGGVAG